MTHYLDNAATTPVRKEAVEAAVEAMTAGWGNPSATYAPGGKASRRLERWRQEVAGGLGCTPEEVFFTSGGTEGNNWAISGALWLGRRRGKHIITTAIEHDAVRQPCKELEMQGYEVTWLRPNRAGEIDLTQLREVLRPDTVLVSMMLVNNELGSILPVAQAAELIHEQEHPPLLHCDGVQAFMKLPLIPRELGVDLLTVSGHKIHAPKGIGALYIRQGLKFPPLLRGGGQEKGLRSGTEATSQIAAFGAAVQAGRATQEADCAHVTELRRYAEEQLQARVPGLQILHRGGIPHILPISMPGYRAEVVVRFLSDLGVYISSGSACHKGKPSHVYAALPLDKGVRDGAMRVSFAPESTKEDIDALADGLVQAGDALFRSMS